MDRLQPDFGEHVGGGPDLAVPGDFAFADQGQGEMGEWGEVAGCSNRALGWDRGEDPPVEHVEESLHDQRPHPGMALGQGAGPEQEHGSHQEIGKFLADTCSMGSHQVVLEGLGLVAADGSRRQRPEPGGDPVDHLTGLDRCFHYGAGRAHALLEIWPGLGTSRASGHGQHLAPAQWTAIDDDRVHDQHGN